MCQLYDDFITSPYLTTIYRDAAFRVRRQIRLIGFGIDPEEARRIVEQGEDDAPVLFGLLGIDADEARWLAAQDEYPDPDTHYQWLLAHGKDYACPPLEPLPESSPEEVKAIKADLMAKAPKACFIADEEDPRDGMWVRWPSANRWVRPGAPRDGDPSSEALALHQASHRTPRKRQRKGGTGAS